MMSAISAAMNGSDVTILEQKDKPCKKIYATGNGRCNFTNENIYPGAFRGNDTSKAAEVLKKFGRDDLLAYFKSIGLIYKNINSYYYPNSEQASSVVTALLAEAKRLNIKIICNEKLVDIKRNEDFFTLYSENNEYTAGKIIFAPGGMASPAHGSDGNLFKLIKKMGHKIYKPLPALVPLKYSDKKFSALAGVRTKAGVVIYIDGEGFAAEEGEIIFNKDNISGIPVMQLSRFASVALDKKQKVELGINLFPDLDDNTLNDYLRQALYSSYSEGKTIYEALVSFMNNKLLDFCLRASSINPDKPAAKLKEKSLLAFTDYIRSVQVPIASACGFDKAQVTAGGIAFSEVNENLESVKQPGIFFAGEVMDIDGTCGGYNLQWAFSSGYIAGNAAAGKSR